MRSFDSAGILPVVGIVALHELGDEQHVQGTLAGHGERDLVVGELNLHIALGQQQAGKLIDRLGRHDEFAGQLLTQASLFFRQRQAPSVGGDHRDLVFAQADEDAVEHVARVIGGNRIRRLAQHGLHLFLRQRDFLVLLELRQRQEFLGGDAVDFVK